MTYHIPDTLRRGRQSTGEQGTDDKGTVHCGKPGELGGSHQRCLSVIPFIQTATIDNLVGKWERCSGAECIRNVARSLSSATLHQHGRPYFRDDNVVTMRYRLLDRSCA